MSGTYDTIVIGVGGMGSTTCWQLAKRGRRVLGLERFDIPHSLGSSHGATRIIRLAYYEDAGYVPFLQRALELWLDAGDAWGEPLYYRTGSLDAGPPDSEVFRGSRDSAVEHGLPHEVLSGAEVNRRFPGYRLPGGHAALLQPDGGFIASERSIVAHVMMAQAAGAEIHAREAVLDWSPIAGGGVRVRTDRATYEAGSLVVSAGAWIGELVPALRQVAVPERQVLGWFQPAHPERYTPDAFPVVNLLVDEGRYYALPIWGVPGFKIGLYHHLGEQGAADGLRREVGPADEAALRACVTPYFPDADGPVMALKPCIFTNTPDEHFIIDRLPDTPEVIVASPCSGHGFKFASVVGEILADLATGRTPALDLGMFRLSRFG